MRNILVYQSDEPIIMKPWIFQLMGLGILTAFCFCGYSFYTFPAIKIREEYKDTFFGEALQLVANTNFAKVVSLVVCITGIQINFIIQNEDNYYNLIYRYWRLFSNCFNNRRTS